MLTLALTLLLSQCQPGGICKPAAVQTPCIATGAFPTCTTSLRGREQCNSSLSNCIYHCNGTAWACLGAGTVGDGGYVFSGCAGAGKSGALCLSGAAPGGVLTVDAGVTFTTGVVSIGTAAGGSVFTIGGSTVIRGGAGYSTMNDSTGTTLAYSTGTVLLQDNVTNAFTGPVTGTSTLTATTYLRTIGVATGSLPTCNAGTAGALEYDTTETCVKYCNGTAWSICPLTTAAAINYQWSNVCFGICSEDVNFTGGMRTTGAGAVDTIVCAWGTAAVGAGNVVVKIRNITAAADVCTCAVIDCAVAANTPTACACSGTFLNGNVYSMQLTSGTTCATTNPANIVCTARIAP